MFKAQVLHTTCVLQRVEQDQKKYPLYLEHRLASPRTALNKWVCETSLSCSVEVGRTQWAGTYPIVI